MYTLKVSTLSYTEGIDKNMTDGGQWKKKTVLSGCDEMRVSQMHKWLTKAEQSMYDVDNASVCLAGSPCLSDNTPNLMLFVILIWSSVYIFYNPDDREL